MPSSYFIETHEYHWESGLCIQVEYSKFYKDYSDWTYKAQLGGLHDTILTLGVF